MIDKYKQKQKVIYNYIKNCAMNKHFSHAYLINTNNCNYSLDFAKCLAKEIICPFNEENKCLDCNICQRIDDNNFLELKIISPDGKYIRKEQLSTLMESYSKQGIEGKKRVYIITECEKMNKSSANSILKFLEEPSENIFAILLTNNINRILSTIVSRCQLLNMEKEIVRSDKGIFNIISNSKYTLEDVNIIFNENPEIIVKKIIEFFCYLEKYGAESLIYIKDKWLSFNDNREKLEFSLTIAIFFYYNILIYSYSENLESFVEYQDEIDRIIANCSRNSIINKLNLLIEKKDLLEYNLNCNMLMDEIIIRMERINDVSSWN